MCYCSLRITLQYVQRTELMLSCIKFRFRYVHILHLTQNQLRIWQICIFVLRSFCLSVFGSHSTHTTFSAHSTECWSVWKRKTYVNASSIRCSKLKMLSREMKKGHISQKMHSSDVSTVEIFFFCTASKRTHRRNQQNEENGIFGTWSVACPAQQNLFDSVTTLKLWTFHIPFDFDEKQKKMYKCKLRSVHTQSA